jgi:hypothetical protein
MVYTYEREYDCKHIRKKRNEGKTKKKKKKEERKGNRNDKGILNEKQKL